MKNRGAFHSFEKRARFFLNKRILTDFYGFFLKAKGFLLKVYEIFGSEMPLVKNILGLCALLFSCMQRLIFLSHLFGPSERNSFLGAKARCEHSKLHGVFGFAPRKSFMTTFTSRLTLFNLSINLYASSPLVDASPCFPPIWTPPKDFYDAF